MSTSTLSDAAAMREVMSRYNEARERWFAVHGSYSGFDAWFTRQVDRTAPSVDPYDRWAALDREC